MLRIVAVLGVVCGLAAGAFAQGRFTGLDTTASGQGTLRQNRFRDERIAQVRVSLRRNGDAEIQIEGDTTATLTGRWTEDFADSINLNLTRGFGNADLSATGKLYLNRGRFDRLDIDGRANGERFAVSFKAQRILDSGDYGNTSPGGRGYSVETARRAIEEQLYRERRERVEVRFDQADTYFVSNGEEGVRGTGRARIGNRDWQTFTFDTTVDTRQNRATRVTYDFYSGSVPGGVPGGNVPAGDFREGRYEIQLVNTGRIIGVGRDGVTVQQLSANNAPTQQWDIESAGGGYYYIRNAESGLVMTVEGNGGNGSSVVVARQMRDRDNQLWEVRPGPDRGFYFISKSGRALDSPSSARFEGGRMQVYSPNGEANQRFRLRQIAYTPPDYGAGQGGSSGSMRWRGRVDDVIRLEVRGGVVSERPVSGTPFNNGRFTFTSPLPRRPVNLSIDRRKARGSVEIIERPTPANNFTAVIEIRDSQGGAADYEFDLRWN